MATRKIKRIGSLAATAALGVAVLGATGPASASSYTCTGYGLTVPGLGLKIAQFCGDTQGSGTYLRTVGAGFSAPVAWTGSLCDTSIGFELINSSGRVYRSGRSGTQWGCYQAVGAAKWTINAYASPGTIRYTLYSRGVSKAVVQQSIR